MEATNPAARSPEDRQLAEELVERGSPGGMFGRESRPHRVHMGTRNVPSRRELSRAKNLVVAGFFAVSPVSRTCRRSLTRKRSLVQSQ